MFFKSYEEEEEYIRKNELVGIEPMDEINWDENGKLILESSKCIKSAIDVENYRACIGWIMLKNSRKMALIKNCFGDIHRDISLENYYVAKYNPIIVPEVARQFQLQSAQYYIVTRAKGKTVSKIDLILTTDFKDEEQAEELIEGKYICGAELRVSKILDKQREFLEEQNASPEDIEIIRRNFIKQTIFNKFIEQTDENNGNWGIIQDKNNRFKLAPTYDLDCSCGVSLKKQGITKRIADNEKEDLESIVLQYKDEHWLQEYIQYVIQSFSIKKAFEKAKVNSKIDFSKIDEIEKNSHTLSIRQKYEVFFEKSLEKLKMVYEKAFTQESEKKQEEEMR